MMVGNGSSRIIIVIIAALLSSSYALSSSIQRTRRDANNAVLAANVDVDQHTSHTSTSTTTVNYDHDADITLVHVEGEPNNSTPPTGPGGKNVPLAESQETNADHVSPMPATPLAFFPESCSSNASLAARECCPVFNGAVCNGHGTCALKLGNQTGQCDDESYASIFWFADYFDKGIHPVR
jgi:hypothetical protein